MEFITYAELHLVYLFIFSLGLSLGFGASVLMNALFFTAAKDKNVSHDEYRLIKDTRIAIWFGILLYALGGIGLFTLAYESMLGIEIFYASVTIVAVLIANALLFKFRHMPELQTASERGTSIPHGKIIASGVVSVVSWMFLILHHSMHRSDIDYFAFMTVYILTIVAGIWLLRAVKKNVLPEHDRFVLRKMAGIALAIAALLTIAGIVFAMAFPQDAEKDAHIKSSTNPNSYSVADVALHDNPEDCWLIIDDLVFDATEAARLHPAMFNCGTDASENYHKNHGEGVSDKMMAYHIGSLNDAEGVTAVDAPGKKEESIDPRRELYAEEGSWNPEDLIVIVEKDTEKLLFMDGSDHTEVGRIHDIGFQPHTSVYSPDAKFMYIIARNGWLTKINLETLAPVKTVKVGENSRGTALTDDGKYLVIGNYEPGNLVVVDPQSMEILDTIALTGELEGKTVESRAGAVVEDGGRVIVALKDLNSVWVVDTTQEGFPVAEKYWNIGGNQTPLHDAFLTPDGKFFIVASMGSNTIWVLDTNTWEEVGEVATGETPHTGPGATWGNQIYVPALGEGLITVVSTETWEAVAYIETGGPGLFVRAYNEDPDYPYVWAETAFGDHHDEIYVIDARTNEIVKTIIPVEGESSWHPEFTNDGKYVYVVSQTANEIEVYDAHTFELVKRIEANTPSAVSNVGNRIEERGL